MNPEGVECNSNANCAGHFRWSDGTAFNASEYGSAVEVLGEKDQYCFVLFGNGTIKNTECTNDLICFFDCNAPSNGNQ